MMRMVMSYRLFCLVFRGERFIFIVVTILVRVQRVKSFLIGRHHICSCCLVRHRYDDITNGLQSGLRSILQAESGSNGGNNQS